MIPAAIRRSTLVVLLTFALGACSTGGGHNPVAARELLSTALVAAERVPDDVARDPASKPVEVLSFFGVRPGMKVADVFSGGGYYSEILSYAVGPDGQVIAHNNTPYASFAADGPTKRFGDNRLPNVRYLVSEADDLQLPDDLDLIIMVMSFHDLYWVNPEQGWPKIDRATFNKQLFAALKPGSTLAIVDHSAVPGSGIEAVGALHRIDEAFVKDELMGVGFALADTSDLLKNVEDDRTRLVFDPSIRRKTDRFMLRFVKPK